MIEVFKRTGNRDDQLAYVKTHRKGHAILLSLDDATFKRYKSLTNDNAKFGLLLNIARSKKTKPLTVALEDACRHCNVC